MGWTHFISSMRARVQPSHVQPDIAQVRQAELDLILGRLSGRTSVLDADNNARSNSPVEPWGLALSGGGIRSATFGLGVLQALARNGMLQCFHYQSSVSGGGYIGGFLQALIRRQGFASAFTALGATRTQATTDDTGDDDADDMAIRPAPMRPELRHLREYSNYLSPRKSPLSGDTLGLVGTYVRNVVLIQVQLCALILALTLLPLLVYAGFDRLLEHWPNLPALLSGWIGLASTALLAYVTTSVNRRPQEAGFAPEAPATRIVLAASAAIVTLALASLAGAVGIASFQRLPDWIDALVEVPLRLTTTLLPFAADSINMWGSMNLSRLAVAGGLFYFSMWAAWLVLDVWYSRWFSGRLPPSPQQRHWLRYLLAALGASVLVGCAVLLIQPALMQGPGDGASKAWAVLVFGPCLVLLLFALVGILHTGLAGPAMSDLQREIWARVGGKAAALVALGMTFSLALVVYGPWLLSWLQHVARVEVGSVGWIGAAGWVATTVAGLVAGRSEVAANITGAAAGGSRRWMQRVLGFVARLAPWVFIFGLLVILSVAAQGLLKLLGWSACTQCIQYHDAAQAGTSLALWRESLQAYLGWLDSNIDRHFGALLLLIVLALATWLLFGWAVDINEFSLNAFYRNRLVRCYLGASNEDRNPEPITNFDLDDDLVLADLVEEQRLHGCRPLYPLLGTALNLVAAKQLDWQDRKAASFCLSPGFCGYLPPDSRVDGAVVGDARACTGATAHAGSAGGSLAAELTLGSAMAISGAAVNPNMGYHSSPAVTFLLTLFDARMGWWLPNLNHAMPPAPNATPFFGGWLLTELLGRTHDGGRYVHLSDGGHFENLGLYELVRRRCRFVLCVDAASDPEGRFEHLGNAVLKCRVDFAAEIDIDVSALRADADGRSERSCAVGSITYVDGSRGVLLYIKPTLTGQEPTDVAYYAASHPAFPHEPTSDQFFDEAQFESYRRLGQDVMTRALEPVLERIGAAAGSAAHEEFGIRDSERKEQFLLALGQQWVAALPADARNFSRHGQALAELFQQLRSTPELAVLDAQLHAAWIDLVPPDAEDQANGHALPVQRRTRLPEDKDFRVCFYFCLQLIRLMESVYHYLDLERTWNHPDNRGWMNAFRNWSWVPMFRIAWTIGAPTSGSRFIAFCQQRLDMPRIDNRDKDQRNVLRLLDVSPDADADWATHVPSLAEQGLINHIEESMLLSEPVQRKDEQTPDRLLLLRLRWSNVLAAVDADLPDTTLGIAVLGERQLRLLRVQGHLRHLGLGTEFMRILLQREPVEGVDIRGGYYGLAGVCRNRVARELGAYLRDMLERTRRRRDARHESRADSRREM